jgi:hypothetical protein
VRLQCPGPHSIEESPPVNEGVEGGNPPYFLEEVPGPYANDVEGRCWLSQKFYAKNLWPTTKTNNTR